MPQGSNPREVAIVGGSPRRNSQALETGLKVPKQSTGASGHNAVGCAVRGWTRWWLRRSVATQTLYARVRLLGRFAVAAGPREWEVS